MPSSADGHASATTEASVKRLNELVEDMGLLFESQTQSYYHDPSSGIAKSGNILANLRDHFAARPEGCPLSGIEEVDLLLTADVETLARVDAVARRGGVRYIFEYRVKRICSILQDPSVVDSGLRFNLWSWMATNKRALVWIEECAGKDGDGAVVPYSVIPSLRCIVNAGMNFDTTSVLCAMDFFGITHGTQKAGVSKKKRTRIGKRECTETLVFMLNKALPNRCVVRDFLMVFRSTCADSRFIRESFRRIVLVGLIGGYETACTRANEETLSVVLRNMDGGGDWVTWITGVTNSEDQGDRQSLLIWIVREYLHNCVSDIPSLRQAICATASALVLKQALAVMDVCRGKIASNIRNGKPALENLSLQDHLEAAQSVAGRDDGLRQQRQRQKADKDPCPLQRQSESTLNAWKLHAITTEFELFPFEQHMSVEGICRVLTFVTSDDSMDAFNREVASHASAFYSFDRIVAVARQCATRIKASYSAALTATLEPAVEFASVDKAADDILEALRVRKSSVKSKLRQCKDSQQKERCLVNLVVLMCCKQVLCSQEMCVHGTGCRPLGAGHPDGQGRRVQFCPWCNRWQCLYSNIAYKKASPLLGRFVINGENKLYCAGTDTGKQISEVTKKDAFIGLGNDEEVSLPSIHKGDAGAKQQGTANKERFRVCRYLPVCRVDLSNVAFVSNRWLVTACVQCHRPYVREFTTPSWPQRTCGHCVDLGTSKKERKCEVCMRLYKPKTSERSAEGHFMYDDYHTIHSFRAIHACTHCSTRLVNRQRYQHLTLTNSVAAAARDAENAAFR